MRDRPILQAVLIAAAAGVCAIVSNAAAGPQRRVAWRGAISPPAVPSPAPASVSGASAVPAAPAASPASSAFAPHADTAWVEISGADASALHARGGVPFLDARRTAVYRDGHIPGARPFSVWEADADEKVRAFFAEGHEPSAPIVVYCSGGDCEDSHMLAQKLYLAGFDAVFVYKDGFPDWRKRGLGTAKGANP
ncbi:MAG: rhodanese-like domain-containing protein [Acidobacteriota bacterium]